MKADLTPAEQLLSLLRGKSLTLAAAESCTGGWFAKRIVDAPGASTVFLGGVVSYTNEIKEKLLGVKKETLDAHTAVSAPVAAEMAKGVRERLGADIGISVTGLAGPGGGTKEIPVGRVFVGLATDETTEVLTLTLSGTRDDVRYAATEAMLAALINRLS